MRKLGRQCMHNEIGQHAHLDLVDVIDGLVELHRLLINHLLQREDISCGLAKLSWGAQPKDSIA